MKGPQQYLSRLPKDELIAILTKQIKKNWIVFGFGGEIDGSIKGDAIEIWFSTAYKNSWKPRFYGGISEHPSGTMITGYFRTSLSLDVFFWIFRGIVAVILIPEVINILFGHGYNTERTPVLLFVFAFSFALEWYGKLVGRISEKKIIEYFETELLAEPVAGYKDA